MSIIDSLRTVKDWEEYFDSFKDHLAPVAYQAEQGVSACAAADMAHPEQVAWARQMVKRIYQPVAGQVYVAVGYQLCSTTMVVGDDGVIIVDPGEPHAALTEAMTDLRRFTDRPIRAVVLTHKHPAPRHALAGVGVTVGDVVSGDVAVIARPSLARLFSNDVGVNVPFLSVGEEADLEIAGVVLTAFRAYGDGDTRDDVGLWFPQLGHLHGSQTIQGETFLNSRTLRDSAHLDLEAWRVGIDTLLSYAQGALSYSGSHMRPWVGNDFILERILNHRDAMEFVYGLAVRHSRQATAWPQLVALAARQLPDHLRDDPWLQPYHGTPSRALPGQDLAQRYVRVLGGREAAIAQALEAMDIGDLEWAAELLTQVVGADESDTEARALAADVLRQRNSGQGSLRLGSWAGGATGDLARGETLGTRLDRVLTQA